MRCYLFDLDGTLFDLTHRLHYIQKEPKDWDAFFDACGGDEPIPHMIGIAQTLNTFSTAHVIFVSGRAERARVQTVDALRRVGLAGPELFMRKDGDHRPDNLVKGEMLDQILAAGWKPIMAFEDRAQVVKMWRSRGIPCAQVAEGDF